jgi:hypothetical protein
MQTTALLATIRLAAANMRQTTINLGPAVRVIAVTRNAIADVALPVAVVTD